MTFSGTLYDGEWSFHPVVSFSNQRKVPVMEEKNVCATEPKLPSKVGSYGCAQGFPHHT